MIIFAYYLEYVTGFEGDTGLGAWYKLVLEWVVVELSTHENLRHYVEIH